MTKEQIQAQADKMLERVNNMGDEGKRIAVQCGLLPEKYLQSEYN